MVTYLPTTIRSDTNPYIAGPITFVAGSNVSITQTGQDITIESGGASIGGGILGGTLNSVLFINPDGILAQNNAKFAWFNTNQQLAIGDATGFNDTANTPLSIGWTGNTYGGVYLQNKSTGTSASGDIIIGADNDGVAATGHFIDIGINNSNYSGVLGTAGDGYIYTSGGHQYIGTDTAGKNLYFTIGGLTPKKVIGAINGTGIGMGTISPTARFHAVGTTSIGTVTFTGAGLNDLTAGGTYNGGVNATFTVTISGLNSIFSSVVSAGGSGWVVGDTFTVVGGLGAGTVTGVSGGAVTSYTLSNTGTSYTTGVKTCTRTSGAGTGFSINITALADKFNWVKTGGSTTFSVQITGSAQTLQEGVTVTFANLAGHTLTNAWAIPVTATNLFTGAGNTGLVTATLSNSNVFTLTGDTSTITVINSAGLLSTSVIPGSISFTTSGLAGGTIQTAGASLLQFSNFRVGSSTVAPGMTGGGYSSTVPRVLNTPSATAGLGFPAANSMNIIANSLEHALFDSNGIKMASTNTIKMGFWGATPIVQPTVAVAGAVFVGGLGAPLTTTDTFDGYTLAQVVKALRNIGALA